MTRHPLALEHFAAWRRLLGLKCLPEEKGPITGRSRYKAAGRGEIKLPSTTRTSIEEQAAVIARGEAKITARGGEGE